MLEVYDEKVVQRLIDRAVPGERLPTYLRRYPAFDHHSSPQGPIYWDAKMCGYMKWAKKDTKYLMELLGRVGAEDDIWL